MTAPLGPRKSSGLLDFNPPRDAEPSATAEVPNGDQNGDAKPTVLSKLQKWADYPSVGDPVKPTNFLPMKTPMSLEIISSWSLEQPPKHSLTVPELLRSQDIAGRCVGMIIDLANHECLYAEDLPESLEYTHIQLVAKVLPPPEAINAVAAAAAEFWSRRPADYIAIHCAYGFNRTGFVVCSYLCQECGMTVPEALESFAQARPPGVKHGKFVDELYSRYGTGKNSTNSTNMTTVLGSGLVDCPNDEGGNGYKHQEERIQGELPHYNNSNSGAAAAASTSNLIATTAQARGEGGGVNNVIDPRDGSIIENDDSYLPPPPPAAAAVSIMRTPPASPAGSLLGNGGGTAAATPVPTGSGGGTPRSGLLSMHLRRGSGASIGGGSSTHGSQTPAGGSFRRDEVGSTDGGTGTGGDGDGVWKEERANSISASDEGYASSASLSLVNASLGSPSASSLKNLPFGSSSASAAAAVRGSLQLMTGAGAGNGGGGGSRTTSSRSLLAVDENREEKGKDITINPSSLRASEQTTTTTAAAAAGVAPVSEELIPSSSSIGHTIDRNGLSLVENDGKSPADADVDDSAKPRTSGQWREMANHLDNKSLMRRETSLGLAKALHEDFGVHDSTPSRLIPSPLMKKLGAEEAEEMEKERVDFEVEESRVRQLNLMDDTTDNAADNEEEEGEQGVEEEEEHDCGEDGGGDGDGGGGHALESVFATQAGTPTPTPLFSNHTLHQNTNMTGTHAVPSSTPPSATSTQQQQHPWQTSSGTGLPLNKTSLSTAAAAAAATAGSDGYNIMPRNMSFESDCHSLGFNAREALTHLRTQQSGAGGVGGGGGVGASFNRHYSVASDLDVTLWETREDESGGSGGKGKGKVQHSMKHTQQAKDIQHQQQQQRDVQRRDCSIM